MTNTTVFVIALVAVDVIQALALLFTIVWVILRNPGVDTPAPQRKARVARFEIHHLDADGNVTSNWSGDAAGAAREVLRARKAGGRWELYVNGKRRRTSEDEQ